MKKVLILVLFILSAGSSITFSQNMDNILENLISKAVSVSPKLKMLERKQDISAARVPQVSNLPDPMLTLGLMNLPINSFSFSQEPMTGKVVGLSQAVPFPGKLNSAAEVSQKDIEITQQEIDDYKNEVRKNVSAVYYDLSFRRAALKAAYKSKALLEQIREVVQKKYAVSKASQQNLIQVEVEITKLKDKIEELKGEENASLAELNSYLLEDADHDIETSELEVPESADYSPEQLESDAKSNRPFLKGIGLAKDKAAMQEDLAEYEFLPNFNFSVQYSQRDEIAKTNANLNDFVSFAVGINLPIDYGGKKSAKVEETQLMQKMYSDQYEASLQMLNKQFGSLTASMHSLKNREKLIRGGLLPQAEQSLQSVIAGYRVGGTDFINVLDAQKKLYDIETNMYKIRSKYYKQLAELEFLTGQNDL